MAAALLPDVLRHHRAYRRVFASDLVSSLGTGMSAIAFPLLVLASGGSAVQAGTLATVSLTVRLALRLPAGHLADRLSARDVMVAADLVRMVAVGSIPVTAGLGLLAYPQLLVVALVEGAATAVFGPAVTGLTRDTVGERDLAQALGLGQAVQAVAVLVGPAVGGALFAVDRVVPFVWDAASYGVSALLLRGVAASGARDTTVRAAEAGRKAATAGMRWLVRQRTLFAVLLYACVVNLVAAAIDVLVVVVLRSHGESDSRIGLILACTGIGAVTGSLLAPKIVRTWSMPAILLGIGVIWTTVLTLFGLVYSVWLTAGLLVALMALSPAAGVVVGSALYSRTPRELLGRVSAATSVLLMGLSALGPVLAGALFQSLGGSGGWLSLAALTGLLTALAWRPLQAARHLEPLPGDRPARSATAAAPSGDDDARAERPGPTAAGDPAPVPERRVPQRRVPEEGFEAGGPDGAPQAPGLAALADPDAEFVAHLDLRAVGGRAADGPDGPGREGRPDRTGDLGPNGPEKGERP